MTGTNRNSSQFSIIEDHTVNDDIIYHEINHYHLSKLFEMTVECINTIAGILVIFAIILSGYNILLIISNSVFSTNYTMINPLLTSNCHGCLTITKVRLMLGEYTALALSVLVAADVLDTVIKPVHAYSLHDGTNIFLCKLTM